MSAKKQSIRERGLAAISGQLAAPGQAESTAAKGPVTAPGTMMAFLVKQSDAMKENEDLKAQLAKWDGADATRKIPADLVVESRWANRHPASFKGPEFAALKEEIGKAGGNVQPIKVRPVMIDGVQKYEVVFGHRRARACRELNLPVLAMIQDVSDRDLFVEMDRENRAREDLRPFEQGQMYQRALDDGLFKKQIELANAVGVSPSVVAQALSIARLPKRILDLFPSPLDIQYRWEKPLWEMLEKHPEQLDENINKIDMQKTVAGLVADDDGELVNKPPSAAEVFKALTAIGDAAAKPAGEEIVETLSAKSGATVAEFRIKGGRLTVAFDKSVKADRATLERVKKAIEGLNLS